MSYITTKTSASTLQYVLTATGYRSDIAAADMIAMGGDSVRVPLNDLTPTGDTAVPDMDMRFYNRFIGGSHCGSWLLEAEQNDLENGCIPALAQALGVTVEEFEYFLIDTVGEGCVHAFPTYMNPDCTEDEACVLSDGGEIEPVCPGDDLSTEALFAYVDQLLAEEDIF